MKKQILIYLPEQFADWEGAFLTCAINVGIQFNPSDTGYIAKTVTNNGSVRSIGGLHVTSDYTLNTIPQDYAALILVGGYSWFDEDKTKLLPIIDNTIKRNIVLGGICNASIFLAINGYLNKLKHTSNMLESIQNLDKAQKYHGQDQYMQQDCVSDQNIVTANGFAALEFTKEILLLLNFDTTENIEIFYNYHKNGFYKK